MTYTMQVQTDSATGTEIRHYTDLPEEMVQDMREMELATARPGDSVTITVTQD